MPIKVLLADGSDIMRGAVGRLLREDPRITLVGEAVSFAQIPQMIKDFKPSVLLMDLSLPGKLDFTPALVKFQLPSIQLLVISTENDNEAQALAASYGALVLLDKMKLYAELVPAIMKFGPSAPGTLPLDTQAVAPSSSRREAA